MSDAGPSRPPVVRRVLVIGLDGGTYDVLAPLVAEGVLPNLARLVDEAALAQLNSTRPCITPTAWTTFQTGVDPATHGILDFRYVDHRLGRLLLNHAGRIASPTLFDAVSASGAGVVSLNLPMTHPAPHGMRGMVVGGLDCPSLEAALAPYPRYAQALAESGVRAGLETIWKRCPTSYEELSRFVSLTRDDFRSRATAAWLADAMTDWRLMVVQFQALDALQHRAWHLLGVEGDPGDHASAPASWVSKTRTALRALDDSIGELLELAQARDAAVVVASDHGFGPFRGSISVAELFSRRGLVVPAGWRSHFGYRAAQAGRKGRKWIHRRLRPGRSTSALHHRLAEVLPIDWRRSTAMALHGDLAALTYLNTPARFGNGPLTTPRLAEQAVADVLAAFREARHPDTGEPLFEEAYSTAERHGFDPLQRLWPDVVAIPAAGWHCRVRLDRAPTLVVDDPSLTGTHRTEGVFMVHAPGVRTGQRRTAELADVAPTILAMLGIAPPASMTGRVLADLFALDPSEARTHFAPQSMAVPAQAVSTADQALVETRLRDLGYLD
jgi:predicted AlkP superfamily phosphohydrolase/phosphomutase